MLMGGLWKLEEKVQRGGLRSIPWALCPESGLCPHRERRWRKPPSTPCSLCPCG